MMGCVTITKNKFNEWIDYSIKNYSFIAQTEVNGQVLYKPIEKYDEIIFESSRPVLSIKEFALPKTETIMHFDTNRHPVAVIENEFNHKQVIFGVRPCDAKGLKILDASFINTLPVDKNYFNRRMNSIIIGMVCREEGPYCFCSQLGFNLDDTNGMDLSIEYLNDDHILLKLISEKGRGFLEETGFSSSEIVYETVNGTNPDIMSKSLEFPKIIEHFNDQYWESIANRCVSCRICAYVCPTCRCFDVVDKKINDTSGLFERIRCWDSCTGEGYRKIAGGHNPRPKNEARLKNRYYCKFFYYPDRFNIIACTGCGRCIESCPQKLDITEVLHYLSEVAI